MRLPVLPLLFAAGLSLLTTAAAAQAPTPDALARDYALEKLHRGPGAVAHLVHPDDQAAAGALLREIAEADPDGPLGLPPAADGAAPLSDADVYVVMTQALDRVDGGARRRLGAAGSSYRSRADYTVSTLGQVVEGDTAHVLVRVQAPGLVPELDVVSLRRSGGAWRVLLPMGELRSYAAMVRLLHTGPPPPPPPPPPLLRD